MQKGILKFVQVPYPVYWCCKWGFPHRSLASFVVYKLVPRFFPRWVSPLAVIVNLIYYIPHTNHVAWKRIVVLNDCTLNSMVVPTQ